MPCPRAASTAGRILLAVLAAALLVGLFPAVSPIEAAQGDQGLQGGWAIDDAGNPVFYHSVYDQLPIMSDAGAGWVRINFRLGACYPDWTTRGCNGRTALDAYDQVVERARQQNLRVLALLSNESWPGSQDDWIANNAEAAGGSGDNGYARAFASGAAGTLARRFAGRIAAWEIWNEPNAWTAIGEGGNPTGGTFLFPSNYAWLLRRSSEAIEAVRSDAVVVSGGLLATDQGGLTTFVRTPAGPRRITLFGERVGERRSPRTARVVGASSACQESAPTGAGYLCDLYVMGIGEAGWRSGAYPLDHVGLHLYVDQGGQTSGDKLRAYVQAIRSAYLAYEGGGTTKSIQVTEIGWTNVFVDAATQARNLEISYGTLRGVGYVGRTYWFAMQDIPEAGLYYGLVEGDGRAKPAYSAYQRAATGAPPPPAATPTPTPPPAACQPRPRVEVRTTPIGGGQLDVALEAHGAINWLLAVEVGSTANAVVDVAGQGARTGPFTASLPPGTVVTRLTVRRVAPGPVTIPLTIQDRCGSWPTFVGGGAGAF